MPTTIRVNDEDKKVLDMLQAKILLETGEKVSYTELIHYLVRIGQGSKFDDLIEEIKPLENIDWKIHEQLIEGLDFTTSNDIDDVVYGD